MNLLLAQEQDFTDEAQITTNEAGESQQEAVNASNEGSKMDECFITSVQIAELFGQVHSKVMYRIEDRIRRPA